MQGKSSTPFFRKKMSSSKSPKSLQQSKGKSTVGSKSPDYPPPSTSSPRKATSSKGPPKKFILGESVQVNYNKEVDLWVHGVVTAAHADTDSYDVTYSNDGYVDISVAAQYIRREENIAWSETDAASSLAAAGEATLALPEMQTSASTTNKAMGSVARTSSSTGQELLDLELDELDKERLLEVCLQFKYLFIEADTVGTQSVADKDLLLSRKEVRNQDASTNTRIAKLTLLPFYTPPTLSHPPTNPLPPFSRSGRRR